MGVEITGAVVETTVTVTPTVETFYGGGGGGEMQTKSVSYTPSETAISASVTPDEGYDGLDKVNVSVSAISSNYVGSGITRQSNLSVNGPEVTAPAGYYESSATASVTHGTAGTPTATKGAVSNHSISVTPSVTNTTGFILGSTKTGTAVTVSASELVSGDKSITANGNNIDVTNYATVSVNVSGGGGGGFPAEFIKTLTVTENVNAFQFEYDATMAAYDYVYAMMDFTLTSSDWLYYSVNNGDEVYGLSHTTHKYPIVVESGDMSSKRVVLPSLGTGALKSISSGQSIKIRTYVASKYIKAGSTISFWGWNYADL